MPDSLQMSMPTNIRIQYKSLKKQNDGLRTDCKGLCYRSNMEIAVMEFRGLGFGEGRSKILERIEMYHGIIK